MERNQTDLSTSKESPASEGFNDALTTLPYVDPRFEEAWKSRFGEVIELFDKASSIGNYQIRRFTAGKLGFNLAVKDPHFDAVHTFILTFQGILFTQLYDLRGNPFNPTSRHLIDPLHEQDFHQLRQTWMIPVNSFLEIEVDNQTDTLIDNVQSEVEGKILSILAGNRSGWVVEKRRPIEDYF